jgi:hypothetical protein
MRSSRQFLPNKIAADMKLLQKRNSHGYRLCLALLSEGARSVDRKNTTNSGTPRESGCAHAAGRSHWATLGAISSILARSRNAAPDFYDVAFWGPPGGPPDEFRGANGPRRAQRPSQILSTVGVDYVK